MLLAVLSQVPLFYQGVHHLAHCRTYRLAFQAAALDQAGSVFIERLDLQHLFHPVQREPEAGIDIDLHAGGYLQMVVVIITPTCDHKTDAGCGRSPPAPGGTPKVGCPCP